MCLGCCGQLTQSLELAMETPSLVKRPNNPLEKFLIRRAQRMVQENIDQNFCLLLGYELLYLWNALGACLKQSHRSIQIGERQYLYAMQHRGLKTKKWVLREAPKKPEV